MLFFTCYPANFFSPNKKNRVIFGNVYGFKDNPRYLFEFINAQNPELECIWIVKSRKQLQKIPEQYNAQYAYSPLGIYYQLTAKIAVVTTGFGDLSRYILSKKTIIQLWHGTPLKKILLDAELETEYLNSRKILKNYIRKIYKLYLSNYDYIVSASTLSSEIYEKAFGVAKEKIINTGLPRADIILSSKRTTGTEPSILYAPTWRKDTKQSISIVGNFLKEENIKKITKSNYRVTVSLHQKLLAHFDTEKYKHIEFLDDDINRKMVNFDYLITDYSSICFDFALTGAPVIFYSPDIFDYQRSRGLYNHYDDITKGVLCQSIDEVAEIILTQEKNSKKINAYNELNNGNSRTLLAEHIFQLTRPARPFNNPE
jgi:CDP-glycerol glycerophosphotransferase (TagB/SpsB family)